MCQDIPLSCAVIVTTPQRLSFIDVAKGIRMFSRLRVPSVAVVENMKYFAAPGGEAVYPFGADSCGRRIAEDFQIPHMIELPIHPRVSECGDAGTPFVNEDPGGEVAGVFQALGEAVVRECAKLSRRRPSVSFDNENGVLVVSDLAEEGETFAVGVATARAADASAGAIDEWTGLPAVAGGADADATGGDAYLTVTDVGVVGNYAIQISYADGGNQVLPLERLAALEPRVFTVPGGGGKGC